MWAFAIGFLAVLATLVLAIAQGKDLYHPITGGTAVRPAATASPIALPRPSPAPRAEATSGTASAATDRLVTRPEGTEDQRTRPRAVLREMGRRVPIADGILALPAVAFYGAPVILDVPGLGYVDVPEDEYARLYDQLTSPDADQIESAMAALGKIKAAEDAAIEAAQRRPDNPEPADVAGAAHSDDQRDLSTPIWFGSRFSTEGTLRRGRRSQRALLRLITRLDRVAGRAADRQPIMLECAATPLAISRFGFA